MKKIENKYIAWLIILFIPAMFLAKPVITRHDVNDTVFVELAQQYPETGALFFINQTDMAGTLIKHNWILTAAHVAADLNVGDSIYSKIGKYPITHIYIHPKWANDHAYDLALLKIKMGNDNTTPIPLYQDEDEIHRIVTLIGNGEKGNGLIGPTGNDGKIRAATNQIMEVSDYWLKWDFNNPENDSTAVTKLEGISGPGDSGGPAFIFIDGRGYLAGISSGQSTQKTHGKEGFYGVREYYTRISSHLEWISLTISQK